jgi:hypothetical protein
MIDIRGVSRHFQVGEQEIELLALSHVEGLVSILRDGDLIALGLQQLRHGRGIAGIVVGEEDATLRLVHDYSSGVQRHLPPGDE